jgi:small subunit ribosomal protein S8
MCQWFNSTFGQILKIFKAFMSNTLIKFLIKLKNAALIKQESLSFDFNKLNLDITELLYNEGLIQSFFIQEEVILNKSHLKICITLRAIYNKPLLKSLKIISTPVKITYLTLKNLAKLPSTKSILVLSTSKGFLTGLECKKRKIGGVLLFII